MYLRVQKNILWFQIPVRRKLNKLGTDFLGS